MLLFMQQFLCLASSYHEEGDGDTLKEQQTREPSENLYTVRQRYELATVRNKKWAGIQRILVCSEESRNRMLPQ